MEKDYVKTIVDYLNDKGIKCFREVTSDDKKNRIDLIIYREDIGYIGIECKEFTTMSSGGVIAKSIKQIMRYKKSTYFNGITIPRWGICFNNTGMETHDHLYEHRVSIFVRHFMNEFGFDYIEFQTKKLRYDGEAFQINPLRKNVFKI